MLEFDCDGAKVKREERYTTTEKKNLHAFANVCLSLSYMEIRFELFKLWFAWGHVKFVRVIIKNLEEIKGQKFK